MARVEEVEDSIARDAKAQSEVLITCYGRCRFRTSVVCRCRRCGSKLLILRTPHRSPELVMPKAKAQKEAKNAKTHLKARLEYLQRAAEYLHNTAVDSDRAKTPIVQGNNASDGNTGPTVEPPLTQSTEISNGIKPTTVIKDQRPAKKPLTNLSRVSISQMRGVSLKTQTRLPVSVKRSYCKKCDTIQDNGVNCERETQNASRGRRKPWADVLVIRCLLCGTEKRFPQTDKRSRKLAERQAIRREQEQENVI